MLPTLADGRRDSPRRFFVPVLALAVVAGCWEDHGFTLGRVSGKVTLKSGEPVRHGSVTFYPDSAKGTIGPPGMATIAEDGSFVVSTRQGGDGAAVGVHKVGIVGLELKPISGDAAPKAEEGAPAVNPINAKLKAAKAPPKQVRGGGDTFTDRGGRVFRYVTPKKVGSPETSGVSVKVSGGSNTFEFVISDDGNVEVK
jgi:hypothetical protein